MSYTVILARRSAHKKRMVGDFFLLNCADIFTGMKFPIDIRTISVMLNIALVRPLNFFHGSHCENQVVVQPDASRSNPSRKPPTLANNSQIVFSILSPPMTLKVSSLICRPKNISTDKCRIGGLFDDYSTKR